MLRRWITTAALALMVLAACAPSAAPATPSELLESTQVVSPLEDVARAAPARPAWMTTPLVNAASGQTFTLADFPNQTVYVEFMATWCTNCRIQQGNVRTVRGQLSADQYVFISLSIEPKDTTPILGLYAQNYAYPWTFAIVPTEMLRALVAQFGQSITNPTATPHIIISPGGSFSSLSTGIHTTDQLTAELTAAAGA